MRDPTAFRNRFKLWKETGESQYEAGLPRFAMGTEGDTLYVEKDTHKGWKGIKNFLKSALNHTLYNFSSGSGGSTNPIHVLAGGANYTGSYIYPSSNYTHGQRMQSDDNGVGLAGSTKYGGKNAVEDRNIVAKQFGRKSNLKKLRDDTYRIGNISFTGPVYEGKIYPTNQDSVYYLPNSVKAEIDSLINVDRSYSVNMNNIRELNRRFPRQILDNVRNARLKPLKNNNKYSLKATKLWDFSSPNIQFGNLYDKLINMSGGNKFVLEQNIPIKFVNKDRTDDWDLIKSTLTQ